MSTPKAKFAGLVLIAALCDGFTLGLTACTDERARTGADGGRRTEPCMSR